MEREKKLVKNTLILTVGRLSTQLASFILLPVYTSLLSTSDYGIVDLLYTYISLLVPIVILQLDQAIFRFLIDIRNNEKEKMEYITAALIGIILQVTLFITIFMMFSKYINNDYKYFLAFNVVASIFSSMMLQISRGLGSNEKYAIGSFISAISSLIFNIIFVIVVKFGANGMLLSNIMANLICSLYIFFALKVYKYINIKKINVSLFKKMLKYSAPLIPNQISWWIFTASDRTIVSYILGTTANGIYSVANKFPGVYVSFYSIFNMTWTESVALHIDDKDSDVFLSKTIDTVFRLFSAVCLVIITCLPFVFPFLINEKFGAAFYQMPILMLSSFFNVVVGLYSSIYIAKKLTSKVAISSYVSAIINIIINICLIKFIGLYAASISTAISYGILMIYRYFDINKYVNVKLNRNIIISTLTMMMFVFTTYYIRNPILNFLAFLVVIVYSLFTNKSLLTDTVSIMKDKVSTKQK